MEIERKLLTINQLTFHNSILFFRLNLKTLVWEIVYVCRGIGAYEPTGRYRHEVGFDKRNIYVLGGGTALLAFDFIDIPVFSLELNVWYSQKSIRDARYGK